MFRLLSIAILGIAFAGCDNRDARRGETTQGAAQMAMAEPGEREHTGCENLPDSAELKELLEQAPVDAQIGGLTGGTAEWGAIVNRQGVLCAVAVATDGPSKAWPGSQAIAKAKAFTANAFSSDEQPMSTARLYTLSQPGHSLWGAGAGNPFDPTCLATPEEGGGVGEVCGGTIVFGGGLPLYRDKTRVGGLGVSGDTACADHEIAKRVRNAMGLNPVKGANADDIIYPSVDGPSIYAHPLCPNTWRNGEKIGEEPPAKND